MKFLMIFSLVFTSSMAMAEDLHFRCWTISKAMEWDEYQVHAVDNGKDLQYVELRRQGRNTSPEITNGLAKEMSRKKGKVVFEANVGMEFVRLSIPDNFRDDSVRKYFEGRMTTSYLKNVKVGCDLQTYQERND